MLPTIAQCLDMALENERLAILTPKQSLKAQHTNSAEFYRNLADDYAKLEADVKPDHLPLA
jgi:hypothetical protein